MALCGKVRPSSCLLQIKGEAEAFAVEAKGRRGRADDEEGRSLPAVQGWSHGGHVAGATASGEKQHVQSITAYGFFVK